MACRYNHFPQTLRIALCFKRIQSDKNKQTNKIQRINTESGHSIIKGKHSKIRVPFFFFNTAAAPRLVNVPLFLFGFSIVLMQRYGRRSDVNDMRFLFSHYVKVLQFHAILLL